MCVCIVSHRLDCYFAEDSEVRYRWTGAMTNAPLIRDRAVAPSPAGPAIYVGATALREEGNI